MYVDKELLKTDDYPVLSSSSPGSNMPSMTPTLLQGDLASVSMKARGTLLRQMCQPGTVHHSSLPAQ